MPEFDWLAEKFEENRGHLRAVAFRMLGSMAEADDAVQESWLRLSRSDAGSIENLAGWLTTVVSRVCLDILRSRTARREESLGEQTRPPVANAVPRNDPEQETLLAESVGLALMVVLDRLAPAERLAFVLHDMFAVSFEEIARIVGRSEMAVRQLASRARRRVQQKAALANAEIRQQHQAATAFLSALRSGDFERVVAVLDPELVVRFDETVAHPGGPREIHGARNWAKGAVAFSRFAPLITPILVNGSVGLVLAPGGKLMRALTFDVKNGKISQIEIIVNPERLRALDLRLLSDLI